MFEERNHQKTATNEEEKSTLLPRQCTVSQIYRNDSKTTWIALWIVSAPTLFSRSSSQQLLAVCRPRKNAPGKEVWLPWRSDIGNWDIFWCQRQIVLQKRHRIVRISVSPLKETMLMNKIEFCPKVVLLVRPGTCWVMCYIYKCVCVYIYIYIYIFICRKTDNNYPSGRNDLLMGQHYSVSVLLSHHQDHEGWY